MLAMAPVLPPAAGVLTNMSALRLCHDGRECGKQAKNFGSAHATVEECAEAARADPECGSAIMWSPVYGKDWGCRCCNGGGSGGRPNKKWQGHRIYPGGACGGVVPESPWQKNVSAKRADKLAHCVEGAPLRTKTSISVYIGYISAVLNADKRAAVRERCGAAYARFGMPFGFYVGAPDLGPIGWEHRRKQGQRFPAVDVRVAEALSAETALHGDLVLDMVRDNYVDKTAKVDHIFRDGLASGAQYIVKSDDDQCVCPSRLLDVLTELHAHRTADEEFYVGEHFWARGDEYSRMIGTDNKTVAPFMGRGYVLSRELARTIFEVDRTHTVLFQPYGTSSEDANVGKWVAHATRAHRLKVTMARRRGIYAYVVVEGSHQRVGKREAPGHARSRLQGRGSESRGGRD